MKKFLTLISVIALTAAIVLTFASCGECKHENASSSVTAPTCTERGYTTYTCNDCGHTYVDNYVDALDHCYSENLIFDSTHHYYECICGEKKDEATHVSSGAATVENDEVCAVCGYVINKAVGIKFNTLTVNGNNVYGKVSNDTEIYSFIGEVVTVGGATYVVSYKLDGGDVITTKTLSLNVGDNTVYVTEYINNEPTNICIVTIRRRPMYEVTFNSNGGTAVDSITVEEDSLIEAPEITRAGYTLVSWDYDFAAPITKDTNINASWEANTDT
ncbi:MAG: InlB B-repeat-containing protein, partial [Clostridia bacterium]|nr:InlB B-repeat-containing protein [Clostridia bacterium]